MCVCVSKYRLINIIYDDKELIMQTQPSKKNYEILNLFFLKIKLPMHIYDTFFEQI